MRRSIIVFLFCLLNVIISKNLHGQMPAAITIDPPTARGSDEITLTLDPSKACVWEGRGSVAGAERIRMHSAAFLIEYIDDWESGSWGQVMIQYNEKPNDGIHDLPELLPNGDGTYSITFIPTDFYGLDEGTIIIGLTMVFNTVTWDNVAYDFNEDNCIDFRFPLIHSEPEPSIKFNVYLEYQYQTGLFDLTDSVFLLLNGQQYKMQQAVDGIILLPRFFLFIGDSVISEGETYSYKYILNETEESVSERQITAEDNLITTSVNFNNIPPLEKRDVTFILDQRYLIREGRFNPDVDTIQWLGKNLLTNKELTYDLIPYNRDDSTFYCVVKNLAVGTEIEYSFLLNGQPEFKDTDSIRRFTVRKNPSTITNYFADYKPGWVPVHIYADMSCFVARGLFDPDTNFLDVVEFSSGGDFSDDFHDQDNDLIYEGYLLAEIGTTIRFILRIDGSWEDYKSELFPGDPRQFDVKDTVNFYINRTDTLWFNDDSLCIGAPNIVIRAFVRQACGPPDGKISLQIIGGEPPYSVLWSNSDTTEVISGLLPGVYWYTVNDQNDSLITDTIEIIFAEAPVAEIVDHTDISYYGFSDGSAMVNASGGTPPYSYWWDGPEPNTNRIATGLFGDTSYHVTVSDQNGCTAYDSVYIQGSEQLFVEARSVNDPICFGDSNGSAWGFAHYAEYPVTYLWDDPANTSDSVVINLKANQFYHLAVTDASGRIGCDSVLIEHTDQIYVDSIFVSNVEQCYELDSGSICVIADLAPPHYRYSLDYGETFQENWCFDNLPAGIYFYMIMDTNDCYIIIDSLIISQPDRIQTGDITGYNEVNESDITFYSVSEKEGSVYNWFITGGNIISGQETNFINVHWGSGESGLVSVIETDVNGCTDDTTKLPVVIHQLGIFDVDAGIDKTIDCGGRVQLYVDYYYNGKGEIKYNWKPFTGLDSDTVKNPLASPESSTEYIVQVYDGSYIGQDTVSVVVKAADFDVIFSSDKTILSSIPYVFQFENLTPQPEDYNFIWDFGDFNRIQINDLLISNEFADTGKYDITLIAISTENPRCIDSLFIEEYISCEEEIVSNPNIQKGTDLPHIYPNPFTDHTIIEFPNPENIKYTLYITDLSGKVRRIVDDIITSQYMLEKGDLKEGFYFVELKGPNIYRGKIVIE